MFTWKYTDLKGIPEHIGLHKIVLEPRAVAVQSQCYRMNPNYIGKVKEEIQRLLEVEFIKSINKFTWLSPIVIFYF